MKLDIQFKLDDTQINFLKENSYWYKYLNRNSSYYKDFINDMKDKYKLKPTDKINKIINDIEVISNVLDVLK